MIFIYSLFLSPWLVCFGRESPPVGHDFLIHEVYRSHTATHHSRWDYSGRVISSSQIHLPDNTQHSQQTSTCTTDNTYNRPLPVQHTTLTTDLYLYNTHNRQTLNVPGGIRTHNPSKQAAIDPCLRLAVTGTDWLKLKLLKLQYDVLLGWLGLMNCIFFYFT